MNTRRIDDQDDKKPAVPANDVKETVNTEMVEQKQLEEVALDANPQQNADETEVKAKEKAHSKDERIKDLLVQLYDLRVTMKEVIDRYQAVTSGQLSGVILLLEDSQNSLRSSLKLKTRKLTAMSEKLCDIKLKPKKGRAKDLAKIEEIIEKMTTMLTECNE
ncbi:MAG: hypothetical protein HGA95_02535 [Caldiserica bacterium]|nr:hypothetical protein [Caldisericota bacterium]